MKEKEYTEIEKPILDMNFKGAVLRSINLY